MVVLAKRRDLILKKVRKDTLYTLKDALSLVKETAIAKFDESIDISVQLGVDPKKSDQVVRGAVVLPAGSGKFVKVAVFVPNSMIDEAKNAGADIVGSEELVQDIKEGNINFDILIATPDSMKIVGSLGQILGPKGLMPNPKIGTVTNDIVSAIQNAKAGQVQYRTDKMGIIHASIGKASFNVDKLKLNFSALIDALQKDRPVAAKGLYLRKISLSSTMGIGIKVDLTSLNS